ASDPADLRVDERDLAEVWPTSKSGLVRFRRVVRRVRVVKMNPTEEAERSNCLEPRQRVVRDVIARPLHLAQSRRLVLREVEIVKVSVETLRDAPGPIEHVREIGRASCRERGEMAVEGER